MDQILRQVGELLLGAVPTVVLLLLTYAIYHFMLHKPLERVLAERRSRTDGAIEKARADVAAAMAKTADYETRLREAKLAVFRMQELRRKEAQAARAAIVARAREEAEAQVRAASEVLQQDVQAAKANLAPEVDRLANEIIRAILKPVGSHVPAVGGQ